MSTASRRNFLKTSAAIGFPTIVPSTVFGQTAPSNHIQVAQIGCGRIARGSEFPGVLKQQRPRPLRRRLRLDTVRLADGKTLVESYYAKKYGVDKYTAVKTYRDYREILADKSIDAVCISTPDHWHAQPAMEAALAGKDIYLQKPASLTIREGRQMADCIKSTRRILQIGSQQRSDLHFRLACELIRNGRIGKVKEIFIGLPYDPSRRRRARNARPRQPQLRRLARLHPRGLLHRKARPSAVGQSPRPLRPSRLAPLRAVRRRHDHRLGRPPRRHRPLGHGSRDAAVPSRSKPPPSYPKKGLWDVHGNYTIKARYANGAVMYISDKFPNGLRFIGEDGWIWVTRGRYQAGDPPEGGPRNRPSMPAIPASSAPASRTARSTCTPAPTTTITSTGSPPSEPASSPSPRSRSAIAPAAPASSVTPQ